jgi:arginyl-tRNA synthetase
LKVDQKENPFNPEESVDFAGIQGRLFNIPMLQSIIRKANFDFSKESGMITLHPKEKIIETIRIVS